MSFLKLRHPGTIVVRPTDELSQVAPSWNDRSPPNHENAIALSDQQSRRQLSPARRAKAHREESLERRQRTLAGDGANPAAGANDNHSPCGRRSAATFADTVRF